MRYTNLISPFGSLKNRSGLNLIGSAKFFSNLHETRLENFVLKNKKKKIVAVGEIAKINKKENCI